MSSRILCTLTLVSVFTQSAFAARHDEVTPFADIKTQLTLRPGNTYLGFMKEHVKPGLDAYEDTIQNDSVQESRFALMPITTSSTSVISTVLTPRTT